MASRKRTAVHTYVSEIKTDVILEKISNKTRRKILSILSEEPMYFNQLAKKLALAQQAILRHMVTLKRAGLIETYVEGNPNVLRNIDTYLRNKLLQWELN